MTLLILLTSPSGLLPHDSGIRRRHELLLSRFPGKFCIHCVHVPDSEHALLRDRTISCRSLCGHCSNIVTKWSIGADDVRSVLLHQCGPLSRCYSGCLSLLTQICEYCSHVTHMTDKVFAGIFQLLGQQSACAFTLRTRRVHRFSGGLC